MSHYLHLMLLCFLLTLIPKPLPFRNNKPEVPLDPTALFTPFKVKLSVGPSLEWKPIIFCTPLTKAELHAKTKDFLNPIEESIGFAKVHWFCLLPIQPYKLRFSDPYQLIYMLGGEGHAREWLSKVGWHNPKGDFSRSRMRSCEWSLKAGSPTSWKDTPASGPPNDRLLFLFSVHEREENVLGVYPMTWKPTQVHQILLIWWPKFSLPVGEWLRPLPVYSHVEEMVMGSPLTLYVPHLVEALLNSYTHSAHLC